MTQTQIDNTTIEQFINRADFHSLKVCKGFDGSFVDHWEIMFEADKKRNESGFYEWEGTQSPYPLFKIFKPKQK